MIGFVSQAVRIRKLRRIQVEDGRYSVHFLDEASDTGFGS
jgi:hypothetical protein